ncbi:hypothetical protein BASA81_006809 [Batrachochytrium salamandrivorans]|nr:hypothetical protein BASA81_006809 [Batrachochytrium salamandrivorans]
MTKRIELAARPQQRGGDVEPANARRLFVSNLPVDLELPLLEAYFSHLCPSPAPVVARVRAEQRYGFLEFSSAPQAEAILSRFESSPAPPLFQNHRLHVERKTGRPNPERIKSGSAATVPSAVVATVPAEAKGEFSVYIGHIPLALTELEILQHLPKHSPKFRPSSVAKPNPSMVVEYWFGFLDCISLQVANECIHALRTAPALAKHKLKVELGHQAQHAVSGGREAVAVFRRSVVFRELPVGATKEDINIVLQVFGPVKRIQFHCPGAEEEEDEGREAVPENLWRVEVEFESECAAALAETQLGLVGFPHVWLKNKQVLVLDNIPTQPSLIEVLEMFATVGLVSSAQILKLTTRAEVEFEQESSAKLVMSAGSVLLRACTIVPELASLDTSKAGKATTKKKKGSLIM